MNVYFPSNGLIIGRPTVIWHTMIDPYVIIPVLEETKAEKDEEFRI